MDPLGFLLSFFFSWARGAEDLVVPGVPAAALLPLPELHPGFAGQGA